jgi:hypothetical protein
MQKCLRAACGTFQILDAVADNQPIGLSELARRLDLPKSTVPTQLGHPTSFRASARPMNLRASRTDEDGKPRSGF